jgi:hypothetical protein
VKPQFEDDLKTATNDGQRMGIQQRLEGVDENIQRHKSEVHRCEGRANRRGEELKQLESTIKEEGLFCVEWCLVAVPSLIYLTRVTKIKPKY